MYVCEDWAASLWWDQLGALSTHQCISLPISLQGLFIYPDLANGETEPYSGQVTSLCHLVRKERVGFDFGSPNSKSCVFAYFSLSPGVYT